MEENLQNNEWWCATVLSVIRLLRLGDHSMQLCGMGFALLITMNDVDSYKFAIEMKGYSRTTDRKKWPNGCILKEKNKYKDR